MCANLLCLHTMSAWRCFALVAHIRRKFPDIRSTIQRVLQSTPATMPLQRSRVQGHLKAWTSTQAPLATSEGGSTSSGSTDVEACKLPASGIRNYFVVYPLQQKASQGNPPARFSVGSSNIDAQGIAWRLAAPCSEQGRGRHQPPVTITQGACAKVGGARVFRCVFTLRLSPQGCVVVLGRHPCRLSIALQVVVLQRETAPWIDVPGTTRASQRHPFWACATCGLTSRWADRRKCRSSGGRQGSA